jgi:hypothetical protein
MTSEAWKAQLREDLERTGERAVRDDMNNRGGLTTGGEERQQIIRQWLRDKDAERESRDRVLFDVTHKTFDLTHKTFNYTRKTYYAALAALLAAVVAIVVTILHL